MWLVPDIPDCVALDRWFSNFNLHYHPKDWLNPDSWDSSQVFLILLAQGEALKFVLLTISQVVLMMLVGEPHFDNHWSKVESSTLR